MRKALTLAGLCAASILGLVDSPRLLAHGGRYGGPTDTVPPNLGGGGDTTPPGNPGGPATPAPPAPTTPGSRGGSTTGSGAAPVTPGGPSAPRSGPIGATKRNRNTKGFEQWEFWWGANDEAYLGLKARLRQLGKLTTTRAVSFGARIDDPNAQVNRVTAEDRERIQAALIAALDSSDADVVDSAVLALARIVKADQASAVLPAITRTLAHPMASARQSATLALGVLGAPEATTTLRELLLDTKEGRRLTGQDQHVEDLVRAFAAASMGMIGAPEQIGDLQRVFVDDSLRANADVKSLALYALGLIKGGHERTVPFLQQQMAERSLDNIVRAQAPIALARIAEQPGGAAAARTALSSMVGFLADDKRDLDLKRSLAIAIGRIATMDDVEALATLADAATREKDEQIRHFSVIALADIAARDSRPELHADGQRKLSDFFCKLISERKSAPQRPYAALALAIQGRNQGVDRDVKDAAKKLLLGTFLDEHNPSYRGAFAIALGLLGADEARHDLSEALDESHDAAFSGYVGISMGLMMARDRADELRRRLEAKGVDPRMKLQFARALGLMGDPSALDVLVTGMKESETLAETASATQALGLIGDRNAVAPLLALLEDGKQPPLRRGFAAVGLGLLAEKSDLPWNALFMIAANYRAKTPALAEIYDIL